MSTTLFPNSTLLTFEQAVTDTAGLRPLMLACKQTMAALADCKRSTGYVSQEDTWGGYDSGTDLRRRLRDEDWSLIYTARSLAFKATQQYDDLLATLTHLAALYPAMQVYQRQLGVLIDDSEADDLDLTVPDWLDAAPVLDEVPS